MANGVEMANDEGGDPSKDVAKQNPGQTDKPDELTPAKPGDGVKPGDEAEAHPS